MTKHADKRVTHYDLRTCTWTKDNMHIGKLRVIELKSFADRHRLKISRNECGETIIPGKRGQIYEYNEEMLGVMFTPPKTKAEPWGKWCPRK